ncbi:transcriptional regulator NrdR [Falseniella ignava]|uniref:Transcriptional repressor NrdR n=1 Tax=Falseniella ignava CCUG 37419 TaxID=883112 RepID=K1LGC5_9LACT|nr:transcriptional regulator NrdR [Falseniella ignava]EKB53676.1 transcriptional regulator NrdR [Falseniella ignava CCUG 37419]
MRCPKCHHTSSKVIDSRPSEETDTIRRRRECLSCGYRFNTYERIEKLPLLVIKRDNVREEFNRDKLLRGIIRSAEKRPIQLEAMNKLVDSIEEKIRESGKQEIPSEVIGEMVMERLFELDEVAYIRFASVYREFQSREMFMKELETMVDKYRAETDSNSKGDLS